MLRSHEKKSASHVIVRPTLVYGMCLVNTETQSSRIFATSAPKMLLKKDKETSSFQLVKELTC